MARVPCMSYQDFRTEALFANSHLLTEEEILCDELNDCIQEASASGDQFQILPVVCHPAAGAPSSSGHPIFKVHLPQPPRFGTDSINSDVSSWLSKVGKVCRLSGYLKLDWSTLARYWKSHHKHYLILLKLKHARPNRRSRKTS